MSFKDWWTNSNNPKLEMSEYLYGTRHIIVLLLTAAMCVFFTLLFRKKSEKAKWILLYVFGGIFLFFEILSRVVNLIIAESYSWESVLKIILPMHICSVIVWVFIVSIFTRGKVLSDFAVIGGLIATSAFLFFPGVGINYKYMAFTCIYSTFTHMLGFVTSVILMTLGIVKFNFKNIWKPLVCFTVMFIWGVILDFAIFPGENYMYIVEDPLGINWGFPYQLLYGPLILLYISLFYLIPWLVKKVRNRKNKKSLSEKENAAQQ